MSLLGVRHQSTIWLLVLACWGVPGCQNKPAPSATPATSESQGATVTPNAASADPATEMLSSALYQLQPENLGIDSNPTSAIAVLNSWREQTKLIQVDQFGITTELLQAVPQTLLPDTQRAALLITEFPPSDAAYIRNALLCSQMAKNVTEKQNRELDRVMALFNFTTRTVMLQPGNVPQLPFTLQRILVFGLGSAEDRAWVFASLLKQQRIDSVILQSTADPSQWLMGVILEGEVYLFDPKLGLPIPRGEDSPSVRITRPATLKEMLAHPDWWNALTIRADQPYFWTSEQLAATDVLIISQQESWSGRMKQLESVLPAESQCVLHDPLVNTSTLPALSNRILAGHADWKLEKLQFWSHPLTVAARIQQQPQLAQQFDAGFQRFHVPYEIKTNTHKEDVTDDELRGKTRKETTEPEVKHNHELDRVIPTQRHLKTRMEHLMGKYSAAISHYHRIRHLAVESPPQEMKNPEHPEVYQTYTFFYRLAASDASFWSATCKAEIEDPPAVANALVDYLRKNPRSDWTSGARYLLALNLADQGQFTPARELVTTAHPDDPHRAGLEVLLKRWDLVEQQVTQATPSTQTDAPATEPPQADDSKPAETKPEETKPTDEKPADAKPEDAK